MAPLKIADFDFLISANAQLHRTDKYVAVKKGTEVILRRGQHFIIEFKVEGRDFNIKKDAIRISFSFGLDARTIKNTKGVATVEAGQLPSNNVWASRVHEEHPGRFQVKVISPANIPVGIWMFEVDVGYKSRKHESTKLARAVHFLFNPWCKEDTVYMPEEGLLDEYVLSEVGKVWVGANDQMRGRQWVYGQFDKYVLPACILLMERTKLHPSVRGDPVRVSRAISKLVNSNDDKGVVRGKWEEPYTDGTPPSGWTGSASILKQFLLTGDEVSYGQCWVFAAVLTTVCRALGLPSRVVSNLNSAHDTNFSLTIDKFYDDKFKEITPKGIGGDSIWNFHVWNDVWMARHDLPPGYGGWQAVDATPQERSDGVYQCGPASVRAVRAGEITHEYDGTFVYASVNADLIRWKEQPSSDFGYVKISLVENFIGKMIVTKKPFLFDYNGDQDSEDITDQYKPREGSAVERLVVYNAVNKNEEAKKYYDMPDEFQSDVRFKLLPLEKVMIGDDYKITLEMRNTSMLHRFVKAHLSSRSVFYTGVAAHDVKSVSANFPLPPAGKAEWSTTVTAHEYLPHLVEFGIMKISALCSVLETNQTWADEDDFQVQIPTISIKTLDKKRVGKEFRISLSFKNPLNQPLSHAFFSFEAPGLTKTRMLRVGEVGPNAEVVSTHPITPKEKGKFMLVASFYSKPLNNVTGSKELKVKDTSGLFS